MRNHKFTIGSVSVILFALLCAILCGTALGFWWPGLLINAGVAIHALTRLQNSINLDASLAARRRYDAAAQDWVINRLPEDRERMDAARREWFAAADKL